MKSVNAVGDNAGIITIYRITVVGREKKMAV